MHTLRCHVLAIVAVPLLGFALLLAAGQASAGELAISCRWRRAT